MYRCGFCTPGIVMSLYALIRNSYDPVSKEFKLSANDIELQGHLDGNLCRCTGYKPILQAAKTFITEDLNGTIALSVSVPEDEVGLRDECSHTIYVAENGTNGTPKVSNSCGRPGGCCRDAPKLEEDASLAPTSDNSGNASLGTPISTSEESSGATYGKPIKSNEIISENGQHIEGTKLKTNLDAPPPDTKKGFPQYSFAPYTPHTELIFPPALYVKSREFLTHLHHYPKIQC